jgi:hypothetical protein
MMTTATTTTATTTTIRLHAVRACFLPRTGGHLEEVHAQGPPIERLRAPLLRREDLLFISTN